MFLTTVLVMQFSTAGEAYKVAIFTSSPSGEMTEKTRSVKHFCESRLDAFNRSGGIAGSPVEILWFDDHFDGEQTQAIVAEALEESRLIAMLGISSSTRGAGIVDAVGKSGVPLISEISADSLFKKYPNIYTQTRSATHATQVYLRFLKKEGGSTMFIGSGGDVYTDEFRKALAEAGDDVELLSSHSVESLTPALIDSLIEEVRTQDPAILSLALGSGKGAQFVQALARAGIEKPIYAATGSIAGILTGEKRYMGPVYKIGPSIPHINNERLAALERQSDFIDDESEAFSTYLSHGVSYGDMLAMMLEAARASKKVSPEEVRAAITRALGRIKEGKRIFRGQSRNWTFTNERSAAMEGMIQWRPPGGGDNKLFPIQTLDTPTGPVQVPVVFAGIDMVRIFHVDSVRKTFDAEFYISLNSKDRIGLDSFEFTNAHQGAETGEELVSYREMKKRKVGRGNAEVNTRLYRVRGRFDFDAKLSNYPFDSQLFSISFQPVNTAQPFLFQPPPERHLDRDFSFKDWTLMEGTNSAYVGWEEDIIETTHNYGSEIRLQSFNRFNFTWLAKRIVLDYYLQVVIPLLLIIIVAYLSVFIPNSKFESVVAIQVTALLSSIALYLSIPKLGTDTATISDQIFLFIQTLIAVMLALSIIRVNAVAKGLDKLARVIAVLQVLSLPTMALVIYLYLSRIAYGS